MALQNNPDLAAARYDPAIGDAGIAAARGAYAPTLQAGLQRNASRSRRRTCSPATGYPDQPLVVERLGGPAAALGRRQLYSAGLSRTTHRQPLLTSLNPQLDAGLALGLSQPLMRDFKIDVPRAQLDLSRSTVTSRHTVSRDDGQ